MPTLQSIGVHPQLRERLQALEHPSTLAHTLGVPLIQIEKVRDAVSDALVAKSPYGKRALHVAATVGNDDLPDAIIVGAITALDLCLYQEYLHGNRTFGISTKSRRLNSLLSFPEMAGGSDVGGVPFGYVTQINGPPASGKTQVALSTVAHHTAQSGRVLFLASGFGHGTLSSLARRLQHSCTRENYENIVHNVNFVTVDDGHDALAALERIEDERRLLVVLDSASGCLSGDLYASGDVGVMLAHRVAHSLRRLARCNGAAVLVTNGTVSGDGGGMKAAMGQAWYVADISVWFEVVSPIIDTSVHDHGEFVSISDKRIRATLEHHSAKPSHKPHNTEDQSVEFVITESGIADFDKQELPPDGQDKGNAQS